MLRKNITYTDYDGVERTETFYFNLSKAELLKMEMTTVGGMQARIQKIVDAKDTVQVVNMFNDIIMAAYGEKSDDGKRFIKSKELSEAFAQTPAYDELFFELLSDPDKATAFMQAIVPAEALQK